MAARTAGAAQRRVPARVDPRTVEFPKAFRPLFQPKRWKVYYGGRDAAKSWNFARALLIQATQDPLRILCCREIMDTLADSVHQLLQDQIKLLGLEDFFTVHETEIVGANGSRFFYAGLRALDAHKVKSFEGVDVVWVEEAHNVTEKSWLTLENTIRAAGSEIWVSFNPELDTDATYVRFVVHPQPESLVMHVTWRDNPFASEVLRAGREALKARDPDSYDNVWEGNPRSVVEGAIYAKEVTLLIKQGRFGNVPYDPKLLVHTIWDLGWNDQTSIIFAQRLASEVRIIDYEEDSFLTYAEWAKRIRDKPYVYGDHWLPHDGKNKTQGGGGKSAQDQLKPLLRQLPKIIDRPDSVEAPIREARSMFPRVYIDKTKPEDRPGCPRLMECLKRFRRAVPETTGEPGAPVKNEYRHGADAFGGLAMIVDKLSNVRTPPPRGGGYVSPDPGTGM